MSEIPSDITYDILKYLPVKSLLRFRCLSKAYCSLIDSRDFINFHLSHSENTNTNRSLIVAQTDLQLGRWRNNKTYTVNLDSPDHQLVEFDHIFSVFPESSLRGIEPHYDDHLRNLVIFGSCNGLIALYHPGQGMSLWNPSTKKQQKLPNFWGSDRKIRSSDYLLDGFGYDPLLAWFQSGLCFDPECILTHCRFNNLLRSGARIIRANRGLGNPRALYSSACLKSIW